MVRLGLVVEGHGDLAALPVLVRRIAHDTWQRYDVECLRPVRMPRSKVADEREFSRAVRLAATGADAVLVVLDSDDDCPTELGPALVQRAGRSARGCPVAAVLAHREYEAWLLASLGSLSQSSRINSGSTFDSDPEGRRDAKGALRRLMVSGAYSETVDQAKLSSLIDVDHARATSRSFDKLCRDLEGLIAVQP